MTTTIWSQWLDALSDAAHALERQLAAGELLDFPQLDPPPLEPGSAGLPPELLPRAGQVLDRLECLERIAQTQRDRLAADLQRISTARPRRHIVPSYDFGAALDVAG